VVLSVVPESGYSPKTSNNCAAMLSNLPQITPTKLSLRQDPFDDPEFIFELKHDGFRAIAYIDEGVCRLVSRRRNAYSRFEKLRGVLAQTLKVKNAILDGEIIWIDSEGRSIFNALMRRRSESEPIFYAFDLLWLSDKDLRSLPLIERKRQLRKLIPRNHSHILFANHIEQRGKDFFRVVCEQGLEGIVAKKKNSVYSKSGWLKIKNPNYALDDGRKELFESFFRHH
jgi:bifunctional non-homologous end joining protein LigD